MQESIKLHTFFSVQLAELSLYMLCMNKYVYLCVTLLYAICVKDARENNSNRFNAAPISFMLCSCTQALLINNFQSDQKSHLIFVPSPPPCPPLHQSTALLTCACLASLSPPPTSSADRAVVQSAWQAGNPFVIRAFCCHFIIVISCIIFIRRRRRRQRCSASSLSLTLFLSLSLFAPIDSCFCCLTRNFTCRRAKIIHSKKVALIYD